MSGHLQFPNSRPVWHNQKPMTQIQKIKNQKIKNKISKNKTQEKHIGY